jgi:uncharacterized protein involved in exopolysaccharide biosynthesis
VGRVLEAIFRRPFRLLIILLLVPLVSLAVAYVLTPRTYQAQASLWAIHRYAVIGATGPESNLQDTPANTQVIALMEMLQTRSFALQIAYAAHLAPTLHLSSDVLSNPVKLDDALYSEISKNVASEATGYNLYTITYANRDAKTARSVIEQVIKDFGDRSIQLSIGEGRQLLADYQTQLAQAQDKEKQAVIAEQAYLSAHPGLSSQQLENDPQYQALHAQTLQAQNNVANIQASINQIEQQINEVGTSSDSLFKTVDAPYILSQPVSRTKTYITVGGISLAVALLACTIYLLILIRGDRSIYTPLDLQKVTSLPVLMQLPSFSSPVVSYLIESQASSRSQLDDTKGREVSQYLNY